MRITQAYINLYDGETLVHTSAALNQTGVPTFLASGYGGLVDRVGVVGYSGYFVMDDVTYNASGVPEPASIALIGGGLLLLGLLRRK
jgi:hypothetical protein